MLREPGSAGTGWTGAGTGSESAVKMCIMHFVSKREMKRTFFY